MSTIYKYVVVVRLFAISRAWWTDNSQKHNAADATTHSFIGSMTSAAKMYWELVKLKSDKLNMLFKCMSICYMHVGVWECLVFTSVFCTCWYENSLSSDDWWISTYEYYCATFGPSNYRFGYFNKTK